MENFIENDRKVSNLFESPSNSLIKNQNAKVLTSSYKNHISNKNDKPLQQSYRKSVGLREEIKFMKPSLSRKVPIKLLFSAEIPQKIVQIQPQGTKLLDILQSFDQNLQINLQRLSQANRRRVPRTSASMEGLYEYIRKTYNQNVQIHADLFVNSSDLRSFLPAALEIKQNQLKNQQSKYKKLQSSATTTFQSQLQKINKNNANFKQMTKQIEQIQNEAIQSSKRLGEQIKIQKAKLEIAKKNAEFLQAKNQNALYQNELQIMGITINRLQVSSRQRIGAMITFQGVFPGHYFDKKFKKWIDKKIIDIYDQDIASFVMIRMFPGYKQILKKFSSDSSIFKIMLNKAEKLTENKLNDNLQVLSRYISEHNSKQSLKMYGMEESNKGAHHLICKIILIGSMNFFQQKVAYLEKCFKKYQKDQCKKESLIQITTIQLSEIKPYEHHFGVESESQQIRVVYHLKQNNYSQKLHEMHKKHQHQEENHRTMLIKMIHLDMTKINKDDIPKIVKIKNNGDNQLTWLTIPKCIPEQHHKNYEDMYEELKKNSDRLRKPKM